MKLKSLSFLSLKKPLGQLIAIFFFVIIFGNNLPENIQISLWTVSIFLKDLLSFLIPFFMLIFFLNSFGHIFQYPLLFIYQISMTMLAYIVVGAIAYAINKFYIPMAGIRYESIPSTLSTWSQYHNFFPRILAPGLAMAMGCVLGVISVCFSPIKKAGHIAIAIMRMLLKYISCLTPFLLLGILVKLNHDGALNQTFFLMFLVMAFCSFIWVVVLLLFYYHCNIQRIAQHVADVVPVGLLGLTTCSSTICLPVLQKFLDKKIKEPHYLFFLPNITNIALMGENFFRTTMILTIFYTHFGFFPGFYTYVAFTAILAVLKLATPPASSSSILIAKPYLTDMLSFSDNMYNELFNCYMPFNAFLVFFNIYSNSVWPLLLECIAKRVKIIQKTSI